jgi:hypothetical protein
VCRCLASRSAASIIERHREKHRPRIAVTGADDK